MLLQPIAALAPFPHQLFCSFFGKDDIYYPQGIKHCNGESQFIDVFPMAKPAVSWRISQI
jgi:hypothetical protein